MYSYLDIYAKFCFNFLALSLNFHWFLKKYWFIYILGSILSPWIYNIQSLWALYLEILPMISSSPLGKVGFWLGLKVYTGSCFREYSKGYWSHLGAKSIYTVVCFAESWPYQTQFSMSFGKITHSSGAQGRNLDTLFFLKYQKLKFMKSGILPAPSSELNAVVNLSSGWNIKRKSVHTH